MASKVVSRRLIASLSVLGLLLSTLLVIVPLTAPAVEQTHSSAATANNQAQQFNFQQPNAGVPQALRVPDPVRGGGAPN